MNIIEEIQHVYSGIQKGKDHALFKYKGYTLFKVVLPYDIDELLIDSKNLYEVSGFRVIQIEVKNGLHELTVAKECPGTHPERKKEKTL